MKQYDKIALNFKLAPKTDAPVFLHNKVSPLSLPFTGPIVRNVGGQLVGASGKVAYLSSDEGQSWQSYPVFLSENFSVDNSSSLICLASGILILSFVNTAEAHFKWHKKSNRPTKNTQLSHWMVRSLDGGKTWELPQKVQTGYAAATTTMIQLKSGEVVVSAQNLDYENARHYALSLVSDDEGASWKSSNRLDLGGRGHHDGCYEGTLVELDDQRVWYCIRTNKDWFWNAYSEDGGRTWIKTEPGLPASSSPAMLTRLKSGRIMLTYNPLYPEGESDFPRRAGLFSENAASWQREELAVRFSEDEGRSWSRPLVIARCKGAWLAYPFVSEVQPGRIWLTTMQSELKVTFWEEELLAAS